jgi:hypothetical protein
MQNVDETKLAWTLIEVAKPHLSDHDRDNIFVIIGAGETFAAMRILLELVANKRIAVPTELMRRCTAWLTTYARHEEEQHLRGLIARCTQSIRTQPAQRAVANPRPNTPHPTPAISVGQLISHAMAAC